MNRILLVEDDPFVTRIARAALSRGGWDIRHCADGLDAVRVASEWSPTLILLDVELPGLDGFEVCASVRASAQGEGPIVVMVTSNDDLASKLMGFAVGADDYLVKPVQAQELFSRVSRLMTSRDVYVRTIEQRRLDAIREIVTTICHRVNSPLAVVAGYVELLGNRSDLPGDAVEQLDACRGELQRITEILERLKAVDDKVVPYVGDARMIDLPDPPT